MKFASLRLVTTDVARLATFYERITGGSATLMGDFAELQLGTVTLALCTQRSVEQFNESAASAAANRSAILEFQVDDVDAEREHLRQQGIDCVMEPTDQPWGNRSMLFRDPDGNLINFFKPASPRHS